MTSISSVTSAYASAPVSTLTSSDISSAPDVSSAPTVSSQSPAPTNADTQAPAVYTALANASASTIRGGSLNISA